MQNSVLNYEIVRELGRGATATVQLAREKSSGRFVALKLFHPAAFSGQAQLRVGREIELAKNLRHPNIVAMEEVIEGNPPTLVMKYVDGENLESFQSRLPYVLPELSCVIVSEITKAMQYAHENGVIHRDLKPGNILISKTGEVFVTDFGLAKTVGGTTITEAQNLVGSLDYLSPEQISGDRITASSDVFSLGSILYFMVTGVRPFSRPTPAATMRAIQEDELLPPHKQNPKVSLALSEIIIDALKKDPAKRIASMKDFAKRLENYLIFVGLDQDFSLRAWITDPPGFTTHALQRMSETLIAHADKAAAKKDRDTVLKIIAQISTLSPNSPAINRLMGSYSAPASQRRWQAILLLIVLIGVGFFAFRKLATQPEMAATPVHKLVVPTATVSSSEPAKPVEPVPPSPKKAKPTPKPLPDDAKETVIFEVPADAEIFWDKKRVDPSEALTKVRPGPHSLIVNRPGFELIRRTIMVKPGEPTEVIIRDH